MSGEPAPLSENVVCLDYSVARGGKLVAWRWAGPEFMTPEQFVWVSAGPDAG